MTQIPARFVSELDTALAELFVPAIDDGQTITCYVDEEMTPYAIQGDNIQLGSSTEKDNKIKWQEE